MKSEFLSLVTSLEKKNILSIIQFTCSKFLISHFANLFGPLLAICIVWIRSMYHYNLTIFGQRNIKLKSLCPSSRSSNKSPHSIFCGFTMLPSMSNQFIPRLCSTQDSSSIFFRILIFLIFKSQIHIICHPFFIKMLLPR